VLVFDEVTVGWRVNCGGIHMVRGIEPDMAAFAKAMSNGYAMAALIGKRAVMNAAQTSFISSTYWTEKNGPTAALASIRKYRRERVHAHQIASGQRVRDGWKRAAAEAGLPIKTSGILPLVTFSIDDSQAPVLATLFTQEMLDRGYLAANRFNSTFAHTPEIVERYLRDTTEVFGTMAKAARDGDAASRLRGPVKHSDFQRLTD
jgi:glutamate-1-semialdehyde aminotransferase